ncbi:hypothetical protein LJC27_02425 [Christensenellaceae bacterium OttesenSCG-928-M15]|nr:hypothetical protein [Christensenellaceae bacterium OttesenSCG-928-M15]
MTTDRLLCITDESHASMIMGLLEDRGVPFYTHSASGAGPYYATQHLTGVKIYVAAEAYEQVKDFIDGHLTQGAQLLENIDWEEEPSENEAP